MKLSVSRGFVDFWRSETIVCQHSKGPELLQRLDTRNHTVLYLALRLHQGCDWEAKLLFIFNWPFPYLEPSCPGFHILSSLCEKASLSEVRKIYSDTTFVSSESCTVYTLRTCITLWQHMVQKLCPLVKTSEMVYVVLIMSFRVKPSTIVGLTALHYILLNSNKYF